MKLKPYERLVVGTAYCGQNMRTGEILELVASEVELDIRGIGYPDSCTDLRYCKGVQPLLFLNS